MVTNITLYPSTYEKSIDDYSRVWNREFATNFLEVLTAREMRDEVYIYLIGSFPNATILPNSRNLPENTMNDYFLHRQPIDRRERSQRRGRDYALAHYFLERFMGEEFTVEIAQVFHRHAIYKVCNVYDVFTLLEDGILTVHPSCQPQHYIRTLKVAVFMDELFSDSDGEFAWQSAPEENAKEVDYENQLAWLEYLEELDQISRLNVRLKVKAVHSSTIRRCKAILLPHIQELVEKGCKMTVSYRSTRTNPNPREKITYDSSMLLSARQLESLVTGAFVSLHQDLS